MKAIFQYMYDHDIKLVDIPDFVNEVLKKPIPFSGHSKLAKSYDYGSELTTNKKSISMLPDKLASSLYNFQKQGIEAGIRFFGRILIGDEMGVGKTL